MLDIIKKLKSIKSKSAKIKFIIVIVMLTAIIAVAAKVFSSGNKNVLNSNAQSKADDLSSLERVKAIYNTPHIKKDLISDEKTQKLLADSGNPIEEYQTKTFVKPVILEHVKSDSKSENKKIVTDNDVNNSSVKTEKCTEYDEVLNRCKMSPSYDEKVSMIADKISKNTKENLSDSKIDGSVKISEAKYTEEHVSQEKFEDNNQKNTDYESKKIIVSDNSPMGLLVASSSKTEVLKGRSISIGGASNQIKAGTTVLAVLNEAKTITSSGETYASASIIGAPFDRQKFPEGVTLLLKLKLNGTQDGIEGIITSCSSRRNSDKSIACAGQLEDISGASALRGEVYSSAGWQIVTTAATTFLAGLSLSKMTTSASTLGTTVDQTTSNALYQALSGAITSMGTQIAASFARSGTQIAIPGRVVVRVLFTQDSVW